jgi:hypothetical protein
VAIAIGAGIALAGTAVSANAASNAADQQSQSSQASLDLQRQQHDQSIALQKPYTDAGNNALQTMQQLNGGNFSSFTQSPDYQFALSQGTKAMDASAAARGNLFSGGYGQQLQQFGQGLATQNYDNFYNHLAGISAQGEIAATQSGYQNAGFANAGTNINTNMGEAQAKGTLSQASAWNNGLNQLASAYGQYGSSYGGGSGGSTNVGSWNGGQSTYPNVSANDNYSRIGG